MKLSFVLATLAVIGAVLYRKFGDMSVLNGCGFLTEHELLIRSSRIITPDGILNGTIHVKQGRIHELYSQEDGLVPSELFEVDYGDLVVAPGIIDGHVEFSEPGFDDREGVRRGTKAASAGGVTTVVDFPMSCDLPMIIAPRIKAKLFRFKEEGHIHMAPIGGIIPQNCADKEVLRKMAELGVFSFHSVLSHGDRSNLDPINLTQLHSAIPFVMSLGVPYSIQIQKATDPWTPDSESETLKSIISLLVDYKSSEFKSGFTIHFTGVSSLDSIALIQEAKKQFYFPVSCELTAPFLYFASRGDGNPLLKMYPPIGSDSNRHALLHAVSSGQVDIIVSGHAPREAEEKFRPYEEALPGISGIQYLLPSLWTSLEGSGVDLVELSKLLSTRPAELFRIAHRTGSIRKGLVADLMVWDPEATVDTSVKGAYSQLPHISPYMHTWLKGEVKATWIKGNIVYTKERSHSMRSCPTIYGLGEWAKTVVFWFYEFNYATNMVRRAFPIKCHVQKRTLRTVVISTVLSGALLWTSPSHADTLTSLGQNGSNPFIAPTPVERVQKKHVWFIFTLGAASLFVFINIIENNPSWFPAVTRANKVLTSRRKQRIQQAEELRLMGSVEDGLIDARQRSLPTNDTKEATTNNLRADRDRKTNTEAESHRIMSAAFDRGLNFFDSAERYSIESSPEVIGKSSIYLGNWIKNSPITREDVVIASKVTGYAPKESLGLVPAARIHSSGEADCRLDRKSIEDAIDTELHRLGVDYIDLMQTHWPDRYVPGFGEVEYLEKYERESISFEEQISAMNDMIKKGKIRHWGLANETSYGTMMFCHVADRLNMSRPVSIQNSFSLVDRTFATELAEVCGKSQLNIPLLPWSPAAGGSLSGKYLNGQFPDKARWSAKMYRNHRFISDRVLEAVTEYVRIANEVGVTPMQLAYMFCKAQPFVGSTIFGATSVDQLQENIDGFIKELPQAAVLAINAVHQKFPNPQSTYEI
eukprot:g5881.t1